MEFECLVGMVGLGLVIAGWLSLLACKFSSNPRWETVGKFLLVLSLCGLGSVTLLAGLLRIGCALTTGSTSALLLLAVIAPPNADLDLDSC